MNYELESLKYNWEDSGTISGKDIFPLDPEEGQFSGILETNDTAVYVVNNSAIRCTNGSLSSILHKQLTYYRARNPVEPYLMGIYGECTEKDQLYTQNISIMRAVSRLSGTSFSGYVELSENIYSGDYYAAMNRGKVEYIGFISKSRMPLVGKDAREAMASEVGIYSIYQGWIKAIDLTQDPAMWNEPSVNSEPIRSDSREPSAGDTVIYDPEDPDINRNNTDIFKKNSNPESTTDFCPSCGEDIASLNIQTPSFCPNCGLDLTDI